MVGLSLARHSRLRPRIWASSVSSRLTSALGRSCTPARAAAADGSARSASASASGRASQAALSRATSSAIAPTALTSPATAAQVRLVGPDDLAHEIVAHDVALREGDAADALDAVEDAHGLDQAGFRARRQVDLAGIAGDDHARALAQAGEEHLHLHGGGVLRLVEEHDGVGQRAAAHEGERRDLDHAGLQAALDVARLHEVVERVVDGPQIGVDLLLHVAGQEAEPLAGLDRRARQDEPLDRAGSMQLHGMADGQPGLAGAGRAFGEDELVLLEQLADRRAGRRCGRARARLRVPISSKEDAGLGDREQRALQRQLLDHAVDVARAELAVGLRTRS